MDIQQRGDDTLICVSCLLKLPAIKSEMDLCESMDNFISFRNSPTGEKYLCKACFGKKLIDSPQSVVGYKRIIIVKDYHMLDRTESVMYPGREMIWRMGLYGSSDSNDDEILCMDGEID